jgi:hypothetical protein
LELFSDRSTKYKEGEITLRYTLILKLKVNNQLKIKEICYSQ